MSLYSLLSLITELTKENNEEYQDTFRYKENEITIIADYKKLLRNSGTFSDDLFPTNIPLVVEDSLFGWEIFKNEAGLLNILTRKFEDSYSWGGVGLACRQWYMVLERIDASIFLGLKKNRLSPTEYVIEVNDVWGLAKATRELIGKWVEIKKEEQKEALKVFRDLFSFQYACAVEEVDGSISWYKVSWDKNGFKNEFHISPIPNSKNIPLDTAIYVLDTIIHVYGDENLISRILFKDKLHLDERILLYDLNQIGVPRTSDTTQSADKLFKRLPIKIQNLRKECPYIQIGGIDKKRWGL